MPTIWALANISRRIGTLALTGGAALVLAACGSSSGGSTITLGNEGSVAKSTPTSATSAPATTATTTSALPAGCHATSAPTPKGPQHLAKPTLKLDPARSYTVKLLTNCGEIDIQLDVKRAPTTSASFAYLVGRGFFDNLTFHRIVPSFVIQGGDPEGTGQGGPGYTVVEKPPANLQYTPGVVAMAKTQTDPPGASGSQFFIVTGTSNPLPPDYALLGKVVSGMSVADAIGQIPADPQTGTPSTPVVISKATLVTH